VNRDELISALNGAMRDVSGQSVLFSEAVADRLGINSTDLECLGLIIAQETVTAGELARASGLTSGAITGVIDRLHRSGFVRREPDPADRRKVRVRGLTTIARRVMPLFQSMQGSVVTLLSTYDDKELALILNFLVRAHEGAVEVTAALRAETATSRKGKVKPVKTGTAFGEPDVKRAV
jgi:DNA-binding MarR family transcriptional regulator